MSSPQRLRCFRPWPEQGSRHEASKIRALRPFVHAPIRVLSRLIVINLVFSGVIYLSSSQRLRCFRPWPEQGSRLVSSLFPRPAYFRLPFTAGYDFYSNAHYSTWIIQIE